MPGPLSRLRERVGVRVFACRHDLFLESIPGPYWRPAFAEKQMTNVDPPPSPPPSPACGRGSNARPPLPLAREGWGEGVRVPQ